MLYIIHTLVHETSYTVRCIIVNNVFCTEGQHPPNVCMLTFKTNQAQWSISKRKYTYPQGVHIEIEEEEKDSHGKSKKQACFQQSLLFNNSFLKIILIDLMYLRYSNFRNLQFIITVIFVNDYSLHYHFAGNYIYIPQI